MARSRNIKPGFFTNDELGELDPCARLLFVGLWVLADREGRVEDRPKKIKAEVLPYDAADANALLDDLKGAGFIERYEADGKKCIRIVNWHKHQTPHHMEVPSDLPPPEGAANRYNHEPLTKQQRERIMRRDRGRCVICEATESLHVDHIEPVSDGGSSDDSNLRILCSTCNLSKGKRDSISAKRQADIDSTSTRQQPDVAPLIPSSLIPDSLSPDTKTKTARKRAAPAVLVSLSDLVADGVEEQHATDWLVARKAKDLPLTLTAWEGIKAEAIKARLTPAEAVKAAACNGWGGFKAAWLQEPARNGPSVHDRKTAEMSKWIKGTSLDPDFQGYDDGVIDAVPALR